MSVVVNKSHFEKIALPESADDYMYVGFRVVENESYKVGDKAEKSRIWIDGEPTGEYLRGACAISHDMIHRTYDGKCGYVGDTILVLGSDNAEGGNDPGEIIMINAVVLDVIKVA